MAGSYEITLTEVGAEDCGGLNTPLPRLRNRLNETLPDSFEQLSEWEHLDLSSNNLIGNQLFGSIPASIAELHTLTVGDLPRNNLTGSISLSIGTCLDLEALDLQNNNLSGEIPTSLGDLQSNSLKHVFFGFLGCLNLSYNNLSGRIPYIGHMTTYDASAPGPYGASLLECHAQGHETQTYGDRSGINDSSDNGWLYLSIEFGFIAGILVPCIAFAIRTSEDLGGVLTLVMLETIVDRLSYWGYKLVVHCRNKL
ncbi:hypothetical protein QYF36_024624 [Acer negundo]|nr:hypothetical protein QYF36_005804 [Acer negundo]KAK4841051.1 hypothetical protein QYF36_024624 [Acer negundo]